MLTLFPGSSAAEQAAVNRPVSGSNPFWGASRASSLFNFYEIPLVDPKSEVVVLALIET